MVLFFPIIAAIPTVIGISEGIAEKNRAKGGVSADPLMEKEQMRKFTLECYCDQNSRRAKEVHNGKVVLRDGKVDSPTEHAGLMANSMLPIYSFGSNIQNPHPQRQLTGLQDFMFSTPTLTSLQLLALSRQSATTPQCSTGYISIAPRASSSMVIGRKVGNTLWVPGAGTLGMMVVLVV